MDQNQQNQQNQQKQKGGGGNQQGKEGLSVQSNFSYSDGWNVKSALTSGAVNAGAYMAGTVFAATLGPVISRAIGGVWSFFSGNKGKQPEPQPQPQTNPREFIGRLCSTDPQLAEQLLAQMQKQLKRNQPDPEVKQENLPAPTTEQPQQ